MYRKIFPLVSLLGASVAAAALSIAAPQNPLVSLPAEARTDERGFLSPVAYFVLSEDGSTGFMVSEKYGRIPIRWRVRHDAGASRPHLAVRQDDESDEPLRFAPPRREVSPEAPRALRPARAAPPVASRHAAHVQPARRAPAASPEARDTARRPGAPARSERRYAKWEIVEE